jgi:molybdopterin molybdotransferase
MISHSEALDLVLNTDFYTGTEIIPVNSSVNRILSQDIYSGLDMPPFNKSMVDGYACLKDDINNELIIDGIIAAGEKDKYTIIPGHCVKIMTGAPVPEGTEIVVMVEDVEIVEDKLKINNKKTSENISPKGEDIKTGERVLKKGTVLKPFHCGILATLGYKNIVVSKKVKVGIIVTGDEIVEPGNDLLPGQIYNANAAQFIAYCQALGLDPDYFGISEDSFEKVSQTISLMLSRNDVLIITGGVSMGDFDYVAPAIKNSGLEVKFDSIAAQPGRPLVYACDNSKFCFGMPGNPVSGLVLFETIVKPFLFKIMGSEYSPVLAPFGLSEKISRKKAQRRSYYPVKLIDPDRVKPIDYHGSAHLNSYSEAFGIISFEEGIFEKSAGEIVYVRQI